MIEAHELTKRYGDKTAVHTLSFTIAPGTVTGFHRAPQLHPDTTVDCEGMKFKTKWTVQLDATNAPANFGGGPI